MDRVKTLADSWTPGLGDHILYMHEFRLNDNCCETIPLVAEGITDPRIDVSSGKSFVTLCEFAWIEYQME